MKYPFIVYILTGTFTYLGYKKGLKYLQNRIEEELLSYQKNDQNKFFIPFTWKWYLLNGNIYTNFMQNGNFYQTIVKSSLIKNNVNLKIVGFEKNQTNLNENEKDILYRRIGPTQFTFPLFSRYKNTIKELE